jgi:hypothetical protein
MGASASARFTAAPRRCCARVTDRALEVLGAELRDDRVGGRALLAELVAERDAERVDHLRERSVDLLGLEFAIGVVVGELHLHGVIQWFGGLRNSCRA